jgi:hypothetical protein
MSGLEIIAPLTVCSLALIVIGGILMASYVPRQPPLAVPAALTAVSAALALTGRDQPRSPDQPQKPADVTG